VSRGNAPLALIGTTSLKLGERRGLRLENFPEAAVAHALEAHADALRRSGEGAKDVLKYDHRSRVTASAADGRGVVVKEVIKGGPRRRIADGFRGSPARRAFLGGHGLLARGIGACTPLAFLEARRYGLPTASTVILEDLRPALPSIAYAARGPAEARAVLDALCQLAIALHRNRVVYGDLRAQHVYVREPGNGGPGDLEIALIDLEGVRFARRLSQRQRIQSLAELNASLADELAPAEARRRVFDVYHRALPFERGSHGALEEIVRRSRERRHLWSGADCRAGGS
jgi:hypothetical protein